jgi:hypothetical protein
MDAAVIAKVKGFGFEVYMRDPSDTYLYFTDGTRIGYMQESRWGGFDLNTVHKPNTQSGTAFGVMQGVDDFTKDDLAKCFTFSPAWASGDLRASAKKWKDMDTFLKSDNWHAGFRLIEVA